MEARGLALEPERLYGYDVELQTASEAYDLGSLGLLSEPVPLGYVEGGLPGFVVPGTLDGLRVIHGSCRKPHGCDHAALTDPDLLRSPTA